MSCVAPPVGRKNLRELAAWIREIAGYSNCLAFPVMEFLEHKMPVIFDNFTFEIVEQLLITAASRTIFSGFMKGRV